jgi:hypothetical protein
MAEGLSGAVDTLDRLSFLNHQLLDAVGGGSATRVAASSGRAARLLGRVPRATALLGGEQAVSCGESPAAGSFTVKVTDAVPLDLFSSGDAGSVTYDGCAVEGVTTQGRIGFGVTSTGPGDRFPVPPFDLGLSFSFTSLSATDGAQSTTVDGGFTMQVATQDGISFQTALSGSELLVGEDGPAGAFSVTLRDFDSSTTTHVDGYLIAVANAALSVSGSGANGLVTFHTSTSLSGAAGHSPNTGVVVATGRNDSTLTLVVLNDQLVELRVDEDGDGVPEGAPIAATWVELRGL